MTAAIAGGVLSMVKQFRVVLLIRFSGNKEGEVGHKKEFHFQIVHFIARNTTNLGVICIIEVLIIEELCSKHDACDQQTVYIQGVDSETWIRLDYSVNVDQGEHETFPTTGGVLGDTREVIFD